MEFRAKIEVNKVKLSSSTSGGKLEKVKSFPTDFANAQKDFEPVGQFMRFVLFERS